MLDLQIKSTQFAGMSMPMKLMFIIQSRSQLYTFSRAQVQWEVSPEQVKARVRESFPKDSNWFSCLFSHH